MLLKTVWVLCPDYRTEGLGEPIAVFATEIEARAGYALATATAISQAHRLVKVAVFPFGFAGGDAP